MKLSIVATLYRTEAFVRAFHERASAAARSVVGEDYEIVLVNDGSPDRSAELAIELTQTDEHVVVVDLSRNFGHHKAMMAGLEHAQGERVFLIDSDLEEDPAWLIEFNTVMEKTDADVVYGRQRARKGGAIERWTGDLYYSLFNWLCNIEHPRDIVTARLMTRRYVDALLRHRERELVISCLWVITGFDQREVLVTKGAKPDSTYNLSKKIEHAANAITSFSEAPLRLICWTGFAVLLVSLAYAVYLIAFRLLHEEAVDGWTSVMVSIWVLGGMIMSFLGIIGIYLAKIFSETKQRPHTIVRGLHGRRLQRH